MQSNNKTYFLCSCVQDLQTSCESCNKTPLLPESPQQPSNCLSGCGLSSQTVKQAASGGPITGLFWNLTPLSLFPGRPLIRPDNRAGLTELEPNPRRRDPIRSAMGPSRAAVSATVLLFVSLSSACKGQSSSFPHLLCWLQAPCWSRAAAVRLFPTHPADMFTGWRFLMWGCFIENFENILQNN